MSDWQKRNLFHVLKWVCYFLVLLLDFVLQQTPGCLQLVPEVKAILIVPLCISVAGVEGNFGGALIGAFGGLVWDMAAGRIMGFYALGLMLVCFGVGIAVELFFRSSYFNMMVFTLLGLLVVTGLDFVLSHLLFRYGDAAVYYFKWVLPTCIWSTVFLAPNLWLVKKIYQRFTPDA